jgi:hypothetical protein
MARLSLPWVGVLVVLTGLANAVEPPGTPHDMAARVDALLAQAWGNAGVAPAPGASDGEFLRRAYLDLTGKIPTVGEARAFLADKDPAKRERLIDSLLAQPAHANHLATTWTRFLLPQNDATRAFGGAQFHTWLADKFADNLAYDALARELLLAKGQVQQSGPVLFYTALELKPEELAASTSRSFLGVQIQCAQCHDHPFDHWTQRDFWGYAAFFARLQRPTNPQQQFFVQVADADQGDVKFPDTQEIVLPKFLGGSESADGQDGTRREKLATWLTSDQNPYFAKATVNRVWANLFGRGLVHPVDDLGPHNPASNPQLLEELAAYFIATNYDVRNLTKALALTKAYQASSASAESVSHPELFARMAIKPLTGEQLYDCLALATARRQNQFTYGGFAASGFYDQTRVAFLAKFNTAANSIADYQNGIPQALTLMNGQEVRTATDLTQSDILVALTAPFFTDEKRVETLFLSTLSRLPRDDERKQFVEYVNAKADTETKRKALGDVLWALLNSAEFTLNH